ncbi:MAG: glycosyltransferase family 4 protein [Agarilytica sp.]
MKRIHYISPSLLPSRAANSVHVMLQCDALREVGALVTLYAKRTESDSNKLQGILKESYGVDTEHLNLVTYFSRFVRGDTLRIAMMAVLKILFESRSDLVLSRNLYAAFILSVIFKRSLIFETHQLEYGFRKTFQRLIMTRPWVKTVLISEKLVECLVEHHDGIGPLRPIVLHDAAPSGITPLALSLRRDELSAAVGSDLSGWQCIAGYFGHLYEGRGIEIIEAMAARDPSCLFLVYGGNDSDVEKRRMANHLDNLRYVGHVPHPVAKRAMRSVDVLLMPYQREVSIGVAKHDTGRWMSPMKMFEYLATGIPVISSNLPVLREVLNDGENCLLVPPEDATAWSLALDKITGNPRLAAELGQRGHQDYINKYNWTQRAVELLEAAKDL